ncbi:hypothetical protein LINPERPRIM_LOCUS4202 [Linum perenne]
MQLNYLWNRDVVTGFQKHVYELAWKRGIAEQLDSHATIHLLVERVKSHNNTLPIEFLIVYRKDSFLDLNLRRIIRKIRTDN